MLSPPWRPRRAARLAALVDGCSLMASDRILRGLRLSDQVWDSALLLPSESEGRSSVESHDQLGPGPRPTRSRRSPEV